jgi:hypothetical protein
MRVCQQKRERMSLRGAVRTIIGRSAGPCSPFALIVAALLLFAGCGVSSAAPPQFSGGSYVSPSDFHFKVTYPTGWKSYVLTDPTAAGAANPVFPLTVTITRSSASQATSSIVSNLTVAVMDLRNPQLVNKDLLKAVTTRSANPAYHAVKLTGLTAYATLPLRQTLPNGGQVITHVDYYLLVNNIEYHISTDAVSGDQADADLASILASFTLTS